MTPDATTSETHAPAAADRRSLRPGMLMVVALLAVYGGLALSVDFPHAAMGIQSDEATYYMMGYSLALDGDLTYRRQDLVRVWKEFPSGPSGLFLKRGRDTLDWGLMLRPPFFWTRSQPDGNLARFYYGKSFVYPLFAAPFVRLFGTNGFLVLHAILLGLVVWCGYLFLLARMRPPLAAMLAGAFVMASIVPVYFVWITPELFNFSLGLLAYFCWLYKEVAPAPPEGGRTRWLFGSASDYAAAALLGIATFSKISNILLVLPIFVWQLWRRRFGRLVTAGLVFAVVTGGFFAANIAITGEWNYQGGDRRTYLWEFPFENVTSTFDLKGSTPMARDDSLAELIFDRRVFWQNLVHNLGYVFVGRYSGLVAYFFPAVFALVGFLAGARRRPGWQWLVLAAGFGQIVFFIVNLPYTWLGGGGSVGNRYFMGAYGVFLFLLPPLARTWTGAIPWVVGGLFTAPLVLNPFATSFKPGEYADHGPLRLLPVERTLVNDLPIMTNPERVRVAFGDNPGVGDPFFQIYFLDRNAYGREADRSFWVKGKSRTEILIKTDRMMKQLVLNLSPGPLDTNVKISVDGGTKRVLVKEPMDVTFDLQRGFWYQARAFVWVVSISADTGFVPMFEDGSNDIRYLGIHVKPTLVEK